jgi:hypothetical protein
VWLTKTIKSQSLDATPIQPRRLYCTVLYYSAPFPPNQPLHTAPIQLPQVLYAIR